MKHIPLRSCIVCRQQKDKGDLLRIVRCGDGDILLDISGKLGGRGAYVCKHGDCMDNAIKKRVLNRVYKCQIDNSVYERLQNDYYRFKTDENGN